MTRVIPTLLLLGLPASGKSEISRYLSTLPPDQASDEFGLGQTIQLDDYPFVHLMRRISAELRHLYSPPVFFASETTPFLQPAEWGTLIHLINEDFADLDSPNEPEPHSAAGWLLERMDRARRMVGLPPVLDDVSNGERELLALAVEDDARRLWVERYQAIKEPRSGATVVIEFARGGPENATLPLEGSHGYQSSLGQLSPEILATASILYVWVTPEESRRRNVERAEPGIAGDASILHHGVPESVMRQEYGIDDLTWLVDQSDRPGTIRVEARGTVYHLPVAVFDNRTDKTSFLRAAPSGWPDQAVAQLHGELKDAFSGLTGGPE